VHLAADHVHDDAEAIEHVLTPELEAELEAVLARPARDPHAKPIPYEPPAGAAGHGAPAGTEGAHGAEAMR
jgi:Mn-dependent DtxR family transcriptional regulator